MRLYCGGRFWQAAKGKGGATTGWDRESFVSPGGKKGRVVAGLDRSDTAIAQHLEICAHRCGRIAAGVFSGDTVTPYAVMDGV